MRPAVNLNLELTDHCNIRCRMCSQSLREEAHGVPMRFMDWETWRSSLQGLQGSPFEVHLCPHWLGEPTIHPQFDRFVEYAFAVNGQNRLFREFKLHTNGVVFGEERSRLLLRLANQPGQAADTFRFIHFSIDAWSREAYLEVKGADRRDQVYRNVERFLELRSLMGLRRPHATLAFVVQPGNAQEARAFRDHWLGLLQRLSAEVDQTVDWPRREVDTIYMRPLNSGDQQAMDRLHARVCRELGLTEEVGDRLRAAGSF
jgi:molybdenum cofactor biosynthesis enzyme MoaA